MNKKVSREVKLAYIEQVLLKKITPPQVAKEYLTTSLFTIQIFMTK